MYLPAFKSAETAKRYTFKGHSAVLLRNIVAVGSIEYRFALMVYADGEGEACYCVASEVNGMAGELGGGSHFLGVFEEDSHVNYGSSDQWADEEKFVRRALELVTEKFGPPVI
ncbi:hypothetical protein [Verrucomicrobium sp. BvORR034]|uniref:hypothetical protein n=1 Tax=Verrucomicrobium sp. BvORR034 TaxID=1396418 RepID=UPI0006786284|nr:hypothetical protein [Verrucomicrobium sp. BvORR034]